MLSHAITIIRERAEEAYTKWQASTDDYDRFMYMGNFHALRDSLNLLAMCDQDGALTAYNALQAFVNAASQAPSVHEMQGA